MILTLTDLPWWALALVAIPVAVLGSGRLTRAIYYDAFPPSAWLRSKWDLLTEKSDWNLLMHCPWCLTHWVVLGCLAWFAVGWFVAWIGLAWWIFYGWFALSYVASMIIVRDDPEDSDD